MGAIILDEGAAPSTPSTGDLVLYAKTDGFLYFKNDTGAETPLIGVTGLLPANNLSDVSDVSTARTNLGLAIGSDVQAYDVDTAKTDVAQNFTAPQRSEPATDNDLSFALSAKNNFSCTPSGAGTLTFTDIATTAGQSGFIKLVNGSNYAISAHADTIISTADLATISVTGTYLLSYFCDGTDVFVVASQDLTL